MLRRLFLILSLTSPLLAAEELTIPLGTQGDPTRAVPENGLTTQQVRARYGPPRKVHPPVGQPPISRWDYGDFSVYFEHRYVIDSVRYPGASTHLPGESTP